MYLVLELGDLNQLRPVPGGPEPISTCSWRHGVVDVGQRFRKHEQLDCFLIPYNREYAGSAIKMEPWTEIQGRTQKTNKKKGTYKV
jgi:hypothetical protein